MKFKETLLPHMKPLIASKETRFLLKTHNAYCIVTLF
jgi:hypothetical protein